MSLCVTDRHRAIDRWREREREKPNFYSRPIHVCRSCRWKTCMKRDWEVSWNSLRKRCRLGSWVIKSRTGALFGGHLALSDHCYRLRHASPQTLHRRRLQVRWVSHSFSPGLSFLPEFVGMRALRAPPAICNFEKSQWTVHLFAL